jgi:hypothetical protein
MTEPTPLFFPFQPSSHPQHLAHAPAAHHQCRCSPLARPHRRRTTPCVHHFTACCRRSMPRPFHLSLQLPRALRLLTRPPLLSASDRNPPCFLFFSSAEKSPMAALAPLCCCISPRYPIHVRAHHHLPLLTPTSFCHSRTPEASCCRWILTNRCHLRVSSPS